MKLIPVNHNLDYKRCYELRRNKRPIQACLSDLLKIDYDQIPELKDYDNWLISKGFYRVIIDVKNINLPHYTMSKYRCIGILERDDMEWSHAVVLTIENDIVTKIEDPAFISDFTLDDLKFIEIFFPISKCVPMEVETKQ